MAIDALVKPFLMLPLFRGLKPLQLTEIVRRAERIVYRPGDVIIAEDQLGDAAVVIVSGSCVRFTGSDTAQLGDPIPEGAIVGELGMLIEIVHSTTVVARSAVRALRLTRNEMHELMTEDPALAEHLSQQIAQRLQKLADELRSVDQALADIAQFSPIERLFDRVPHTAALH